LLVALPRHDQFVFVHQITMTKSQRLADTKASRIEQREQRLIAEAYPDLCRFMLRQGWVDVPLLGARYLERAVVNAFPRLCDEIIDGILRHPKCDLRALVRPLTTAIFISNNVPTLKGVMILTRLLTTIAESENAVALIHDVHAHYITMLDWVLRRTIVYGGQYACAPIGTTRGEWEEVATQLTRALYALPDPRFTPCHLLLGCVINHAEDEAHAMQMWRLITDEARHPLPALHCNMGHVVAAAARGFTALIEHMLRHMGHPRNARCTHVMNALRLAKNNRNMDTLQYLSDYFGVRRSRRIIAQHKSR